MPQRAQRMRHDYAVDRMDAEQTAVEQHGVKRRELIAGGAAGAVTAVLGGASEAPAAQERRRQRRRDSRRVYDVAVVGAGLAGLTAARHVRSAGRSVIVLEARRRVGGRNFDHRLGNGNVAELGGEWAGPGQDKVMGLARELGVSTFATYSAGSSVYYRSGQLQTYSGDVPPANPASLAELVQATVQLNEMAASVRAERAWTAPQAGAWDQQTIASWAAAHLRTEEARDLIALAARAVYGDEPSEISLLDLLSAISGVGGDINTLIGSAQSIRFVGGPQQLSIKLARGLGSAVHLGVAVIEVEWGKRATLHTASASFHARRAILTPPKPLIGRLIYSPALPPAHDQILQRQPMGSVVKVNAIYPTPFWRAHGLNGAATSDMGPIRITYDNSPPDGKPGILVGFMEGDDSRAFYGKPAPARRQAALDCFARYFGEQARHPSTYVDLAWAEERYTRGAYGSYNPPGVLTSLGNAAAEPVGVLHFAGADMSALWPGYMDGAIRSGERAAKEALARL
jgi:monoamine oxidase